MARVLYLFSLCLNYESSVVVASIQVEIEGKVGSRLVVVLSFSGVEDNEIIELISICPLSTRSRPNWSPVQQPASIAKGFYTVKHLRF